MNFASSSYGGLKQSEEKFSLPVTKASGAPSSVAGSRQRQVGGSSKPGNIYTNDYSACLD